ncbi:hypothetical protein [Zoogloea sp. LCSB751]|uniref:hypothetical protein n=1 Tax=Zoogloea sp. LCSB751 TaxID=1965277 RepID=UPI00137475C0|nr:hypothetical protein [Zoogloea sp. LCSB751]
MAITASNPMRHFFLYGAGERKSKEYCCWARRPGPPRSSVEPRRQSFEQARFTLATEIPKSSAVALILAELSARQATTAESLTVFLRPRHRDAVSATSSNAKPPQFSLTMLAEHISIHGRQHWLPAIDEDDSV